LIQVNAQAFEESFDPAKALQNSITALLYEALAGASDHEQLGRSFRMNVEPVSLQAF
jgi:hypothetical protein